jgi:predicted acyl esterase
MRDGVKLATDVYFPSSGAGGSGAILIRLPYDKVGRYTFIPQVAEYFAANGFVCITQDVRGKYGSEGSLTPFVCEANDGWDTVEWIVNQPWSNGRIGTWGDSYYGFTQWALASLHHPAHRAMVPRVTGHAFGDFRPGGGLASLTLMRWLVEAWSIPELITDGAVNFEAKPLINAVSEALPNGDRLFREYVALTQAENAWSQRVFPEGNPALDMQIPALHMGGWFDNLQFWQMDDWHSAQSSPAAEHQFLRMGTVDHEDYPWRDFDSPLESDFGQDTGALSRHIPKLLDETISFFRHYLNDYSSRWPAATVTYEVVRGGTHASSQWPPTRTHIRSLFFSPGALRFSTPEETETAVTWVHDPSNPVPLLIESEWDQNRRGLPDESALSAREDLASFDSEALGTELHLTGPMSFVGSIEANTTWSDVVVRVLDVDPLGRARLILGNATQALADGVSEFSVRLGDTAYRLPAGHKLRCVISSSLSGQHPVHPGTEDDPWTATEFSKSTQTLHLRNTRLMISVDSG